MSQRQPENPSAGATSCPFGFSGCHRLPDLRRFYRIRLSGSHPQRQPENTAAII
nr:hypothetical protein [uncultured Kingella sp.]